MIAKVWWAACLHSGEANGVRYRSRRASLGRHRDWSIRAPQPLKDRSLHTACRICDWKCNKNFAFQPGVPFREDACEVSTRAKPHHGLSRRFCLPCIARVSNAAVLSHYESECGCLALFPDSAWLHMPFFSTASCDERRMDGARSDQLVLLRSAVHAAMTSQLLYLDLRAPRPLSIHLLYLSPTPTVFL